MGLSRLLGNSGEMQVSNYKRQVFTFISVFCVCVCVLMYVYVCVFVIVYVSFFVFFSYCGIVCSIHFSCTYIQFIYLMCMDSRFKKETNFKKQLK